MRTFGVTEDNRIDELLQYGTNIYKAKWYQNDVERTLGDTRAVVHFIGSGIPIGSVTKDYMELKAEYLNFMESDAVRFDLIHGEETLSNVFYIGADFNKKTYSADYRAYSSLIDLGIKLDKWNNAPKSATIKTIAHHYLDQIGIVFDVEPSCSLTFDTSMTDFSALTLCDLISCVSVLEKCNYKLKGVTLYKVVSSTNVVKTYDIDDVVYSENLTQTKSDKKLDYITVKYNTVKKETDPDTKEVTYEYIDNSYTCGDTQTVGFAVNVPLIPTNEASFKSYFNTYYQSIKGIDFNSYEVVFLGDARVEVGDKIEFANDTTSAVMNVGELTWHWDGGLKCTVSSGSDIGKAAVSGFNLSQIVSNIQAMTNALRNVQFNAVYTNELYAKIANLGFASIKELEAEVAKMGLLTAEQADIKYAKIDMENVEKSTIGQLLADIGLITDATIVEGHVTGYLDSVKINANDITTGTLTTDRLVIRGTDKSLVYELNNITGALQSKNVDTLNGEILTDRSINVDKIVAGSITANELNIESITGNSAFLNSIFAKNITATGTITGLTLKSGLIESFNYVKNVSGLQIDLLNGTWDSAFTKINSDGTIEALRGKIGCFDLSEEGFISDTIKIKRTNNSASITMNNKYGEMFFWANSHIVGDEGGENEEEILLGSRHTEYITLQAIGQVRVDSPYLRVKGDVTTDAGASLNTINTNLTAKCDFAYLWRTGSGFIEIKNAGINKIKTDNGISTNNSLTHNTENGVIKINTKGYYLILASVSVSKTANPSNLKMINVLVNGVDSGLYGQARMVTNEPFTTICTPLFIRLLNANDYLEMVFQDVSGSATIGHIYLSVVRLK